MAKIKPQPDTSGYKTEEMLKEEAKERAEMEKAILAKRKPQPESRKKAENFWYHYKWHTIAGVVVLGMAIFFIKDVVFTPKADLTVIMVTGEYLPAETSTVLSTALEELMDDFNDDGKVTIAVDNISLPVAMDEIDELQTEGGDMEAGMNQSINAQSDYASVMKLTTVVAAGTDPLYLLDEAAYQHLLSMAGADAELTEEEAAESMFLSLADVTGTESRGLPVSATALVDYPELEPIGEMTFYIRDLSHREKELSAVEYCMEQLSVLVNQ